MSSASQVRFLCIGFRRWKSANIKPIVSLHPKQVLFLKTVAQLVKNKINSHDIVVTWGCEVRPEVRELVKKGNARLLHV